MELIILPGSKALRVTYRRKNKRSSGEGGKKRGLMSDKRRGARITVAHYNWGLGGGKNKKKKYKRLTRE